ncbi:MAG: dimethyl sulfoxide reductase anchor subunit [Rhodospirillaceae bacterium]|jgi:sulfite dehydrogenase (quinone) subunit SoeC|nr:dimethyl sulfoxide reductase anchor subunit [Rhodospirillaceae bacterium]MBT6119649.1 dimethyl sulfoxide reductase anchor subunit [Rhodospirillaceae bacterium]
MHPARSIVLFTSASGAGYGLLALLGLLGPTGLLPQERGFGAAGLALALALVVLGLVSSTFHLGHPERAWRALSQWRSSWLSREGVAALLTFLPAGLFALGWVFNGEMGGGWALAGWTASLGAVVTVACTGMIYASLKPIPRWRHPLVLPLYLAFAALSGLLLLNALLAGSQRGIALATLIALALVWIVKLAYWRAIERAAPAATPESATGLGKFGKVRLLEPPHTGSNYLLDEMGFQIARKHARTLRGLALLIGGALPVLLIALGIVTGGVVQAATALIAAVAGLVGIVLERWLFFAEAKHTVNLYYGDRPI